MPQDDAGKLIPLALDRPIWDRFFSVFPLVIVGSQEKDGQYNLAPKHMAMPLGWENHYCFVCSPRHTTYHNIRRHGVFTVNFPRPSEVLLASLAAAPRCEDLSKPSLLVLPTFPARHVEGALVKGCYLYLECTLHSIIDGFGPNSLIIGNVVAAAHEDALRAEERDESDQIFEFPLLAYVSPGPRIAKAVHELPIFAGLNDEQVARLAGVCGVTTFEPGETIFCEGERGGARDQIHVVLQGEVAITVAAAAQPATPVGVVRSGECLGEMSLLTTSAHSATATAVTRVETASLGHEDLAELIRLRPDIGLHIYRNLAVGMGEKLKRLDVSLADR